MWKERLPDSLFRKVRYVLRKVRRRVKRDRPALFRPHPSTVQGVIEWRCKWRPTLTDQVLSYLSSSEQVPQGNIAL